jgi:hypothetical protein
MTNPDDDRVERLKRLLQEETVGNFCPQRPHSHGCLGNEDTPCWCEQTARAALAAAEQWEPIETAPKDGTLILAWNGCWIEIAMWQRPDGINPPRWRGAHCGVSHIDQPKLWMPLQPPPGDKP